MSGYFKCRIIQGARGVRGRKGEEEKRRKGEREKRRKGEEEKGEMEKRRDCQ